MRKEKKGGEKRRGDGDSVAGEEMRRVKGPSGAKFFIFCEPC
jgi:hypothetical protein